MEDRMRPIARGIGAFVTALALAACSGTSPTQAPAGGTQPPAATTPAATTPAATTPAATTPAATTAASAPCTDSTGTTVVAVGVANFQWQQPINAKVGDVITWTNGDTAPHRVALDDGSCAMSGNIPANGSKSLVFSLAGTFPFHCAVHPTMLGTITIS
jgi:plastocyanin